MSNTFSNERVIKAARKKHYCDWCGKMIPEGSSYISLSGVCEGDFCYLKYHPDCIKKHNKMCSECLYTNDCQTDYLTCKFEKERER